MVESFLSDSSDLSWLSATPSVPDEMRAEELIRNYTARDAEDRTEIVLSNFLRYLPSEGKNVVVKFLVDHPGNAFLYQLYRHLWEVIVKPSK